MKRSMAVMSFLLWIGITLSAYYVIQKPGLLHAFTGLADTIWTLIIAALLLFSAYGIGMRVLSWMSSRSLDGIERLLLGVGLGLGGLGLLGLAISAAQIATAPVFLLILIGFTVFFILNGVWGNLRSDLRELTHHWNLSFSQYNVFTKVALVLIFTFSFLLTLVPPFEAFDALLYHLTQPARILQDGGLRPVDIPHFWFPNLTENIYLWTLALGSDRAPQMIHWAWGLLSALLLWRWAVKVWSPESGRKTLLLLAAMPSLPMLASWAYADMALIFYATATLYALTFSQTTGSPAWLWVAAIMAGLAMAVKYTSFTVPLSGGLLILIWKRKLLAQAVARAAQFSLIALIVAAPWYIRNAIVMWNPFYPFAFGGRYWDAFRADWYANPGTGIGWNLYQLFLLPFQVSWGHLDQNFFDGRIGPLFLLLAPLAVWILFSRSRERTEQGLSLQAIGLFSAISFAAWTVGVINSQALWQARLLFPALIPFALPTALAWDGLKAFDSSRLKISFFSNVLIGMVIALTVFENGMFVLQRNPLAVALGAQSRAGYIARVNPSYAALMDIMDELPAEAHVYSLFEPRSYGLPRPTQPDAINYNFFDDLHRHETSSGVIQYWQAQGYTHILVYERGKEFIADANFSKVTAVQRNALEQTLGSLELVSQTPDQVYSIYRVP